MAKDRRDLNTHDLFAPERLFPVERPAELLKALDTDARLAGHYRLDAVRAHLFEKAGEYERAIAHYRAAAERTTSIPERNYLTTKAARVAEWLRK